MPTIKIKTINGEESQETEAISDLKVTSSTGKNVWIDLPVSYTRENLSVGDEDIATPENIKDWKHLERIADKIIQGKDISIGLLIGGKCSRAWNHWKSSSAKIVVPMPSELNWNGAWLVLLMKQFPVQQYCVAKYQFRICPVRLVSHYFAMETEVKDVAIRQMLHRVYAADFIDHCSSKKREDFPLFSKTSLNTNRWKVHRLEEKKESLSVLILCSFKVELSPSKKNLFFLLHY